MQNEDIRYFKIFLAIDFPLEQITNCWTPEVRQTATVVRYEPQINLLNLNNWLEPRVRADLTSGPVVTDTGR